MIELSGAEKREIAALRAFIETASYPRAAEQLGISYPVLQNLLVRLRHRYGVAGSTIGVLPALAERGILTLDWQV